MISPDIHYNTVRTKIYEIPVPATWKDVSDVLYLIRKDPELNKPDYDDAVMVHCNDEVLSFIFEIDSRRSRHEDAVS